MPEIDDHVETQSHELFTLSAHVASLLCVKVDGAANVVRHIVVLVVVRKEESEDSTNVDG